MLETKMFKDIEKSILCIGVTAIYSVSKNPKPLFNYYMRVKRENKMENVSYNRFSSKLIEKGAILQMPNKVKTRTEIAECIASDIKTDTDFVSLYIYYDLSETPEGEDFLIDEEGEFKFIFDYLNRCIEKTGLELYFVASHVEQLRENNISDIFHFHVLLKFIRKPANQYTTVVKVKRLMANLAEKWDGVRTPDVYIR